MTGFTVLVPMKAESEPNRRDHWRSRHRRVKKQRGDIALVVKNALQLRGIRPGAVILPCTVTLVRIAPRALDGDNHLPSLKAVRDEVAVWLGLPVKKLARGQSIPVADDRDPRVTWRYDQERGGIREYAVRITVEPRA